MPRVVGLHSRTGSAEAVAVVVSRTARPRVTYLNRWSLDLVEGRAERQIYHVVADLPLADAENEVRRFIDLVAGIAVRELRSILAAIEPVDAVGVIVGDFPVPGSLATILSAHTLLHAAEGALFRDALLDAATTCAVPSVAVSRDLATTRLAGADADAVAGVGSAAGRPWRKEHKLATVAAIVASARST